MLAQGKPVSEQLELTRVIFQDSDSHRDLDGCKFVKVLSCKKSASKAICGVPARPAKVDRCYSFAVPRPSPIGCCSTIQSVAGKVGVDVDAVLADASDARTTVGHSIHHLRGSNTSAEGPYKIAASVTERLPNVVLGCAERR